LVLCKYTITRKRLVFIRVPFFLAAGTPLKLWVVVAQTASTQMHPVEIAAFVMAAARRAG